jgi:hypothetical protein
MRHLSRIKSSLQPQTAQPQAKSTPSSGFLMGLKDPITGGAQLLPRALAGISKFRWNCTLTPVSQLLYQKRQSV